MTIAIAIIATATCNNSKLCIKYQFSNLNFLHLTLLQDFQGNSDRNTVNKQILFEGLVTTFVRVLPKAWHVLPCLRIELYGASGKWAVDNADLFSIIKCVVVCSALLRCFALRCVALRCVVLCCVAAAAVINTTQHPTQCPTLHRSPPATVLISANARS